MEGVSWHDDEALSQKSEQLAHELMDAEQTNFVYTPAAVQQMNAQLERGSIRSFRSQKSDCEDAKASSSPNIFVKRRTEQPKSTNLSFSRELKPLQLDTDEETPLQFNVQEEVDFEVLCLELLQRHEWAELCQVARGHLKKKHTSHFKALFYYGIALYKQNSFRDAITLLKQASAINNGDAQLHYNLGLAFFKLEDYSSSVEHFSKCVELDPRHPFAYNNLAFIFNMYQVYKETL